MEYGHQILRGEKSSQEEETFFRSEKQQVSLVGGRIDIFNKGMLNIMRPQHGFLISQFQKEGWGCCHAGRSSCKSWNMIQTM